MVIFQPVLQLQAYPTRHSWIITARILLGNLECHWKLFNRQLIRTQQFLRSLDQHPSAPTQLLYTLQLELSNIQDIYNSGESTITSAIQLLNSNQPQTCIHHRRSLLPFLGDAPNWLTGTATTKDIHSIRTWINQLIATQTSQCNTLVHVVSILNITRYATQVNRHSINTLIDAVWTTSQDINNLCNLTTSLPTSINFNQMILHIRSVFANLWDSLHYIWMVSTHTMEYINATTSGTLSPHVLPIIDLQKMLQHIADTLPPMLYLPISSEDTLHFYRYLHTHILIENKHFLLLIDVPIQDRSCQITIHQILTLDIPHGNYSACYDVNTKYFGVTKDATMAVELSTTQLQACQQANGHFCHISTPFKLLANPPTCSSMETIPIQQPIHILKLPMACRATSSNFYLPPRYETPILDVIISLNMTNLHMINISAHNFHIWQHLGSNSSDIQLQHLTTIPSIPVHKIYQHLLNSTMPIVPFNTE